MKSFDSAWTSEVVSSFPRLVALEGDRTAFACRLIWDARLFVVSPVVLALTDDIVEVDTLDRAEGQMTVRVPEGASMLFFDARGVNLYPAENIDAQVSTRLEATDSDSAVEVPLSVTSCAPWALEVEADWTSLDGLMLPTTVRLVSRGPHPAPAGITATVTTLKVSEAATVAASAELRATQQVDGDTQIVSAQLSQPLAPGSIAAISFPYENPDSTPKRNQKLISGAVIDPPEAPLGMRVTEKFSSYPITPSGTPVSTFEEVASA